MSTRKVWAALAVLAGTAACASVPTPVQEQQVEAPASKDVHELVEELNAKSDMLGMEFAFIMQNAERDIDIFGEHSAETLQELSALEQKIDDTTFEIWSLIAQLKLTLPDWQQFEEDLMRNLNYLRILEQQVQMQLSGQLTIEENGIDA